MCHNNVINYFAGRVTFVSICDRLHFTANNVSVLQDMSAYVKKVHFKLHESYPNPNRGLSAFVTTVTDSCSMHFQWLGQRSSRCTLHTRGGEFTGSIIHFTGGEGGSLQGALYTLHIRGGGGSLQGALYTLHTKGRGEFTGSTIHFTHKGEFTGSTIHFTHKG